MFEEFLAVVPGFRRHFGQPDGGFNGFDLAEEGADAIELVTALVLQQTHGFRRRLPIAGVGDHAPFIDLIAQIVDEAGLGVLLFFGGEVVAFVEDEFFLRGLGMGDMNFASRRLWMSWPVGWPSASSCQCWPGYSYGELRMGLVKNSVLNWGTLRKLEICGHFCGFAVMSVCLEF